MTKGETSELWYKDGLKFTCSGCGDCCTGAPGFVWVDQSEMQAIADSLSMPLEDFEDQYTRKIGARRSLKEFSNGDCVFFDNETRHCEVYSSRPHQCKTWPFWTATYEPPKIGNVHVRNAPAAALGNSISLSKSKTGGKP